MFCSNVATRWMMGLAFAFVLSAPVSAWAALVGHYKLDETAPGPVVNEVGADGTNVGATINQTGQIDQAYAFNGSTQFSSITNPNVGTGTFSVSAWINVNSLSGFQPQWGAGIVRSTSGENIGDFMLDVDNTGRFHFFNWRSAGNDGDGDSITAPGTITAGSWTHVAATWDGSLNRLYVNGSPIAINNVAATDSGWGIENAIGRSYDLAPYHFNGLIDDVGIWTGEALSDAQINTIYTNGLIGLDLSGQAAALLPAPEPASSTLCYLGAVATLWLKRRRR